MEPRPMEPRAPAERQPAEVLLEFHGVADAIISKTGFELLELSVYNPEGIVPRKLRGNVYRREQSIAR